MKYRPARIADIIFAFLGSFMRRREKNCKFTRFFHTVFIREGNIFFAIHWVFIFT